MADKAMGMILELLKDAFEDAKIAASFYEAKKTINKLGLNYTKIHACPTDCIRYRKWCSSITNRTNHRLESSDESKRMED
ncbi:hypothetical protein H5410_046234 [Solanum commersonii]|uniref:Uncharacterized protein n=1 Tax=Solanum commersonii TaxID=4109 RepID=A0A9J5XFY0_SOLCO|nr:hypothetical protein H5410_046234 [Solanum commersonii]